jgi:hypothetical protein
MRRKNLKKTIQASKCANAQLQIDTHQNFQKSKVHNRFRSESNPTNFESGSIMSRFIQPVVSYFYQEFFYVLCGGYEKDWTKNRLTYVDVAALLKKKPPALRRKDVV